MLQEDLIEELRGIVYDKNTKPKDRVEACKLLYKCAKDTVQICEILEAMAKDNRTPDTYRIKAMDLLGKIKAEIGNTEVQQSLDIQSVQDSLLRQYCGTIA